MFFKNVKVFQITQAISLEDLEQQLSENIFKPCSSQEYGGIGWTSPLGRDGQLLSHTVGECTLLTARKQEKILPASVVNELLEEKIHEIEEAESRKVYRKERTSMRDEIIFELMPKAFTRSSKVQGYIDTKRQLIFINATSAPRAEEFLNLLRESLGSLPVVPLSIECSLSAIMTWWLRSQKAPAPLFIGSDCELQDQTDEKNRINCKHQELDADEVAAILESGKCVTNLALLWHDRISFTLHDDLSIKKVVFEDILQERLDGMESDDKAQLFDNTFSIMSLELGTLIDDLLKCFGIQEVESPQQQEPQQAATEKGDDDDPLYREAVAFVVETRRATISAVQRKLRIGYNRAARIIEQMEVEGIVSEMSSGGGREVLQAAA